MKVKVSSMIMAISAIFLGGSLQSCHTSDPEIQVYTAPYFKAANVSAVGEKPLAANSGVSINCSYTVTVMVNGESQVFSGTFSSTELPVVEGNEVEIKVSFDNQAPSSYVCFTMPDGSTELVSKSDPSFMWVVPESFQAGDKIVAQWSDKSGKIEFETLSSSITLIDLKRE